MNNQRQVTIRGTPTSIEAWIQTLTDPITDGWSRAPEIEQKVKIRRDSRWPICLVWSGNSSHPRMALFLRPVSDAEIEVSNIVTMDRKMLTSEDRTAAIEAFRKAIVVLRGDELELTDKPESAGLSEQFSPQAQARFLTFARTANKGVLHSGLDLPRWYDFLIQLHREEANPPRAVLEVALKEEKFSQNVIEQLLSVCEHTEGLLSRYDAFGESA